MADSSKFTQGLKSIASNTSKLVKKTNDLINGNSTATFPYRDSQTKAENDKFKQFVDDTSDNMSHNINTINDYGDINNNTINDILTNVFNGNIFDAGVSAINLQNINSKWDLASRTIVDENKYHFLYNLDNTRSKIINPVADKKNGTETGIANTLNIPSFLNEMEDPTILGYSMKIDMDNSVLFGDTVTIKKLKKTNTLGDKSNADEISKAQVQVQTEETVSVATVDDILVDYLSMYYNDTAIELLENFRVDISKIFTVPNFSEANKANLKNHYIKSVSGLEKLDNMFVKYAPDNDANREVLTLTLYEDVRLFTTNLKYMYNNFVYNYNQGIRVVPDNLLKFTLYIKIAEKRTFTLDGQSDDVINQHTPTLIYQLHGCEFIFDESIVPGNVAMMELDSTTSNFAELKIKISYKKVNRIFSKPSSFGKNDWVIDDSYVDLNTVNNNKDNIITEMKKNGFRPAVSNLVTSTQSLRSKISQFTTNGFKNNSNTLAGKFATQLGNNALKSGSQFVAEEATKMKNKIQGNIGKELAKSSVVNNIKNLLKSNITLSTGDLRKMLPIDSVEDSKRPFDVNAFSEKGKYTIQKDAWGTVVPNPNIYSVVDLAPDMSQGDVFQNGVIYTTVLPNIDIVPDSNYTPTLPNEIIDDDTTEPNKVGSIKPRDITKFVPNKDTYADVIKKKLDDTSFTPGKFSIDDIVPDATYIPNLPKEDLSNTTFKPDTYSVSDIVPDSNYTPTLPKEDLSNGNKNLDKFIIQDIVPNSNYIMNNPISNIHGKVDISTTPFIIQDIVPDSDYTVKLDIKNINNK